jgi:hypothetical protein
LTDLPSVEADIPVFCLRTGTMGVRYAAKESKILKTLCALEIQMYGCELEDSIIQHQLTENCMS